MTKISQRRLIPSTSMLMAFDAAARSLNFSTAALDLNHSQGAVSRQIGALEAQLDTTLFKRVRKSVYLTDAGKAYAKEIHSALHTIRNASLNVMSNSTVGFLNLGILPTFGSRWLMPRIPDFLQKQPDIRVNFITTLKPFDNVSEDLHSAIHFGFPDWPESEQTFLMQENAVPVCAPSIRDQYSLDSPSALKSATLLSLTSRPQAWANWFQSFELEAPIQQGLSFEQLSIIPAAIAGMGAALLPKFLV